MATTGHKKEAVNVEGLQTSLQKMKDTLIGIPNTSNAVLYTQEECNTYNGQLTGALNSSDALTAEQAAAYNAAVTGATKQAGDTLSAAEANLYNATLAGAISTSDVKTPAVPQKVKDYVDNNFYTKAQIDAKRSPQYNPTTKRITFPATAAFTYQKANKRIILSQ